MRRTLLTLLAASSLAVAVPTIASAQPWQTMADRQYSFLDRVDDGVRSGALTPAEAARIRSDFDSLMRMERDYRRSSPGLTTWELQDLDRRFDVLSDRLSMEVADNDRYGGRFDDRDRSVNNIRPIRVQLDNRIERAFRAGEISRVEADRLHRDANDLERLEVRYRTFGISAGERDELNRRIDMIEARIDDGVHLAYGYDPNYDRYGSGYGYRGRY
jgi:hypothetical protein